MYKRQDESTGALTFKKAPDFENPLDLNKDNSYSLRISATDLSDNKSSQTVSVKILDVDEIAPKITGLSGESGDLSSSLSINENQTSVGTFTSNETVTWSISGGIDKDNFLIDESTGALTFKKAPEDSFIENLSLSSPPEIDQVTVSLAENVPTEVRFSSMDMLLDKSPESPERPFISGVMSSASRIFTVTD